MNDAMNNILTRKSVREFVAGEVEQEKIDNLLKAAMAAPSARNQQTWEFIVVKDRDILLQLAEAMPYAKMAATAALAIVVCGNLSRCGEGHRKEYWKQDCSAATENILLAAHAQGLGAVWTAVYSDPERVEDAVRILGIPDGIIPLNIIPIGYPLKYNTDENIHYNSDNIHKDRW